MLYNQEDEEYKKRLEEAKQLRQSAGMITNAEKNNKFVYDDEYQSRLDEAKKLRESVGMITHDEKLEFPKIEDEESIVNEIDEMPNNEIQEEIKTDINESMQENKTPTTISDRIKDINNIKNNYEETIQNNNQGLKDLPKTAGMTARENIKNGNNILPSNDNTDTITVNSEELNDNIFQDIPGLLQNTWRGGVNGLRQILNYNENLLETTVPQYKERKEMQFLTSPNVSVLEKWQYQSKNDMFIPKAIRENIPVVETNKQKEKIQNDINKTNLEIQETASKMSNEVTRKLALDIMPSIGQMSVGTILSYADPALGLGYFITSAGGSYYDDGIQRGMSQEDALLYGTIMGAMEGATEQIGLNQFKKAGQGIKALVKGTGKEGLKSLAKQETINSLKDVFKNYGIGIADNFIQEAVIDPIQEATADLVDDKGDWDGILQKMLSDGIDGAIVAAIVGGADVGINSCISIVDKATNGNTVTQDEYRKAIQDIQQDGRIGIEQEIRDSILYQTQNFDKNTYYEAITDNNGNINVIPVKGTPIENVNQNININPVVIKDNNTGYFNVIDSNSGLLLDSHPYRTEQEAEIGYNSLISNVDNATIKNINNRVTQNVMEIQNKIVEVNQQIENYARNLSENAQIQVQNNQTTNDTTLQEKMNTTNSSDNNIRSERIVNNNFTDNVKQEQLNIIQQTNPMQDDYHTGIRTVDDIKTFQEAYDTAKQEATDGGWTEYASYPDITNEMIEEALNTGKITVYSSNTIKNGTFVTPSYEQALEYAGMDSRKVKSRVVNVDDVAWINLDEGQYAKIKKDTVARFQLPRSSNNTIIEQNSQNSNTNSEKVAKSSKIQYNENGIQLGKKEYANVTSLINTNKPNDTGIQSINLSDYFYAYENNGFDNNRIFLRIKIEGNEELINFIRKDISNGNIKGTEDTIRLLENYEGNGRRYNNSDNATSQRRRTDGQSNLLHTRQVETERETNQGRNNQESNRNKSRIDNKSNVQYNKNGIKLSKQEYANVMSLISTNKPTKFGKHYINSADNFYVYYNNGFGNNTILAKIPIEGNEARIKSIREEIFNERVNQKGETSNTIIQQLENERRRNNSNDAMSTRRRESEQNDRLRARNVEEENQTRGRRDSDESTRVKSELNNKTNVENSNTSSFLYDNHGNKLSNEQQELFKDSKVRDKDGRLLVMYHGTEANVGIPKDSWFSVFDLDKAGSHGNMLGDGFYFTADRSHAEQYAHMKGSIYETYLNIKNPLELQYFSTGELAYAIRNINPYIEADIYKRDGTIDGYKVREYLINNGYDGIHSGNTYVAFYPNQIKNITNIKPTVESPDIRYDRINQISTNKNTNTEKVDNVIQKELHNRIINATLSKNSRKNTFLGIVSDKVANKIKSLFGIDVKGRRHMITDYDIRHILNQHGDEKTEKARGQIAVTKTDIEKIPDIINNYDSITKGTPNIDTLSKKKFNTIRYTKKYNDNITYVVEVIPSNNNQLNIKTMWKKEVKINKKNNSARVSYDNNTLPYTSETKPSSSYSNDSITQNRQEVKNEPYDERKASDDREYYRQQKQNNYLSQITREQGATYAQQSNANKLIEDSIREIEETGAWDNSIPVTKLTDIRKEIEKYLGFGIYKGHFRQQAYGIYNRQNDSIKVKEYKDIDTILHETGHALDIGKRLNVDKTTISDELIKAVDKHGGYENETREVRLEEGFAEVIKTYAIRPDLASSNYPNTVAILEGIRAQDKSFNDFIEKMQNMTYNYIHQSPGNRTLNSQSIGERTDEVPRTARNIKETIAKAIYDKDYVLKETVNEFAKASGKSMKEVEPSKNAYILTRLASGVQNKAISMISDGYIDLNGNKVMPGLNQLGEILDNNPQRFNDLRAYLVASRDLDYKAKNLKTGLRTNDSKYVVNQFKNDKQIQKAAKVVYDTLDGVLKYATDNGLISKETADSLKESNAFYVPFQRVLENDRGNQVGRRGAIADIIRQRTGSELDIKDVLENVVTNSANIIQQVENNNVLRALYKQGEEAGIKNKVFVEIPTPMKKVGTATLATWENELQKQGVDTTNLDLEKTIDIFAPNNKIDRQNLITSFIDENGKRVYLQFASGTEDLFNSTMNLDKNANSQFLKIMRAMNMPLRYGATMANVGFAIPNMISDTAQATIYSEAGFIPVVDNAIGVLDVLTATNKTVRDFMNRIRPEYAKRINNLYVIYQQTGASSSTRMSQYRKSAQEIMGDVYGTSSKNLGINDKFRPLKNLLDVMTYIPELSESSTRFRVFERNYENYKNKGGTEIDARIKAAIESRDATQDFGRTGTITREINQLIPFSAARVGSAYTFSEKISANPKVVGAKIALLSVVAMAIKALGYDDDEIEELNQRKKDDNFVLKLGDTVVTIKKPQGILRSIVNLTEYIQDLVTGHIEEGKEAERLGEWLNNAIMDNMPADEVTGLVPNAVAPLIENAINKDFYYNSDIVKDYDTDLPDYMQYYDYNSQLAIWLGKIFNYSPAKIDNLISGYFGGLGTTVTNLIDWLSGKLGFSVEEPNMGLEDGTIGKRFVVNVNENSQSVDDVYSKQEELTKKQNGGTITEEETQELEKIKEAVSKMAALNKQIKAIKQDENMSGDEKAEKIRPLQEQKTDVARQALGKDPIYTENTDDLEALSFYPSRSELSLNGRTLELTEEMKKEYQDIAYEQYKKYEKQGLYSEEYLEKLKEKCKDIAKKKLMQKYKLQLK